MDVCLQSCATRESTRNATLERYRDTRRITCDSPLLLQGSALMQLTRTSMGGAIPWSVDSWSSVTTSTFGGVTKPWNKCASQHQPQEAKPHLHCRPQNAAVDDALHWMGVYVHKSWNTPMSSRQHPHHQVLLRKCACSEGMMTRRRLLCELTLQRPLHVCIQSNKEGKVVDGLPDSWYSYIPGVARQRQLALLTTKGETRC